MKGLGFPLHDTVKKVIALRVNFQTFLSITQQDSKATIPYKNSTSSFTTSQRTVNHNTRTKKVSHLYLSLYSYIIVACIHV